jgi:hypothetical protein
MFNIKIYKKLFIAAAIFLPSISNAAIIASTDFGGRVVTGNTASSITWVTNGVANPGDVSADFNLFDTANAKDKFAVDRNLHSEGDWLALVSLLVGGNNIFLGEVTLDAYIFNNGGNYQGVSRDLDLGLSLLGSDGSTVIHSEQVLDIYPSSGLYSIQNIGFDFTGNTLLAGTQYYLGINAIGQGPGNNAGFDNLTINGTVPEPSIIALFSLGLAGLGFARRRQS